MDRPLLVYTTFPDMDIALSVGEGLVRDRLIACINVLPGMRSVYAWKGEHRARAGGGGHPEDPQGPSGRGARALKERHPYETPVILFISRPARMPATLAWLLRRKRCRERSSP